MSEPNTPVANVPQIKVTVGALMSGYTTEIVVNIGSTVRTILSKITGLEVTDDLKVFTTSQQQLQLDEQLFLDTNIILSNKGYVSG